jgi:hypothetical protein
VGHTPAPDGPVSDNEEVSMMTYRAHRGNRRRYGALGLRDDRTYDPR